MGADRDAGLRPADGVNSVLIKKKEKKKEEILGGIQLNATSLEVREFYYNNMLLFKRYVKVFILNESVPAA